LETIDSQIAFVDIRKIIKTSASIQMKSEFALNDQITQPIGPSRVGIVSGSGSYGEGKPCEEKSEERRETIGHDMPIDVESGIYCSYM